MAFPPKFSRFEIELKMIFMFISILFFHFLRIICSMQYIFLLWFLFLINYDYRHMNNSWESFNSSPNAMAKQQKRKVNTWQTSTQFNWKIEGFTRLTTIYILSLNSLIATEMGNFNSYWYNRFSNTNEQLRDRNGDFEIYCESV